MPKQFIRGTHLSYSEVGTGAPLVLLHGFPLDSRIWAAQIAGLSHDARVIAIDLRGFGESWSTDAFSMESLADDVHDFLQSIGAVPCVLAGLSMGGYVAFSHVKKYPADISGLILVDTKADADTTDAKAARNQMIELVRSQGSKAIAEKMQPKMLAESTTIQRPRIMQQLRQMMEACAPLTIEHAAAAMRDRPDHNQTLAGIEVSTLIIVGEFDAITPPAPAEAMQKKITGAKLAVIKEAGHMSPLEQPEQVNAAIRSFLHSLQ